MKDYKIMRVVVDELEGYMLDKKFKSNNYNILPLHYSKYYDKPKKLDIPIKIKDNWVIEHVDNSFIGVSNDGDITCTDYGICEELGLKEYVYIDIDEMLGLVRFNNIDNSLGFGFYLLDDLVEDKINIMFINKQSEEENNIIFNNINFQEY